MSGMTERDPDALLADKGYDADAIRADLAKRQIEAVIPGRSNRRVKIEYDRTVYKQRNRIERMLGNLKINRAIATRVPGSRHFCEGGRGQRGTDRTVGEAARAEALVKTL